MLLVMMLLLELAPSNIIQLYPRIFLCKTACMGGHTLPHYVSFLLPNKNSIMTATEFWLDNFFEKHHPWDSEENGKELMVNRCRQNCFRILFRELFFHQQCHTTGFNTQYSHTALFRFFLTGTQISKAKELKWNCTLAQINRSSLFGYLLLGFNKSSQSMQAQIHI